ncbi:diguanylate cyclase (GGDEF)-like protein [Hypnocyclicus thermotrophus]|uniref:Diguanylate cyclase (GGDEF)-like protein n=1 Tax=Hypnocyclicus thermotrophus TaxID=1627895 RepID=A0AA46I590_9FUSO|nr:EAL domain-containing protein [Hypnocyclicus thermotrophus]TDT69182.1 diguanylate cyclase (GGDEF)-like protein [Hypnocyclicus thermotrophus]
MKLTNFKIVLIYFIFSFLWVIYSDKFILVLTKDPIILTHIQTYKGSFFIFLSTFLIYLLIYFETKQKEKLNIENLKNKNLMNNIINNTSSFIFIKNLNGEYILTNKKYQNILENPKNFFNNEVLSQIYTTDEEIKVKKKKISVEIPINNKIFLINKFPIFDKFGNIEYIGGIGTDITTIKKNQLNNEIKSLVFENSSKGIVIFNKNGDILETNNSFKNLFPVKSNLKSINDFKEFFYDKNEFFYLINAKNNILREFWMKKKDGTLFSTWINFVPINYNNFIIFIEDISQDKTDNFKNKEVYNIDRLTGLPNRFLFRDRLSQTIINSKINNFKFALIYLDIDNFNSINTYYNFSIGDKLLKEITNRISTIIEPNYTFSRISGDEFGIIVPNFSSITELNNFLEKIQNSFNKNFYINNNEINISISLGISIYPDNGLNIDTLEKNSIFALRYVKNNGKNGVHYFTETLNKKHIERIEISNHLKNALKFNELELYYQPQVNISTGQIIGVESLIRWKHSTKGFIPPVIFIPIAEENGMIHQIGEWVINTSLNSLKEWNTLFNKKIEISINLSPLQFRKDNIVNSIYKKVKKLNLDPKYITFEITEGILIEDIDKANQIINKFKNYGFNIALDDFGTGYSSLNYLRLFKIDKLKIDRIFIADYPEKDEGKLLELIINLGKYLNFEIIAEGVETPEQYNFIKNKKVDTIQGYYFYKPMQKYKIEELLKK